MPYQFTHFRRGEFDAYLRFVSRLRPEKGPTPADLRHRWRTFDNPWDGVFLLAHTDEDLAATLTLSRRRLLGPGGAVLPCFELGDGWTSDRHRKKGLFFALGERARDFVFDGTDVDLIIGAPNPSAEPNWRKHRYLFTGEDGTQLVLLPSAASLAQRLGIGAPAAVTDLPRGPSGTLSELTFLAYAAATADFPRMNDAAGAYLRWRFFESPDGYRFFRAAVGAASELLCALRVTHLGDLPVLVVSERYLDRRIDRGLETLPLLRRIAARYYRGHGGVYVNTRADRSAVGRARLGLRLGAVHRPQPLIFLWKDGQAQAHQALLGALRENFQLSDCDVG